MDSISFDTLVKSGDISYEQAIIFLVEKLGMTEVYASFTVLMILDKVDGDVIVEQ